jgi:hypothetical protein
MLGTTFDFLIGRRLCRPESINYMRLGLNRLRRAGCGRTLGFLGHQSITATDYPVPQWTYRGKVASRGMKLPQMAPATTATLFQPAHYG